MTDFICDSACTYRNEGECQLGLPSLSNQSMSGFCPKMAKKNRLPRSTGEI